MLITDMKSAMGRRISVRHTTSPGRRLFIGSAAGAVTAFALPRIVKGDDTGLIRPPAALDVIKLYSVCTRCGSCIKACPTRILTEDIRISPGFLTPKVIFTDGYCLESCNSCSIVCPSGAITSFRVEAKSQIHMGLAEIKTKDCLLTSLKERDRCKAVCPYDAVEILTSADNSTAVSVISGEKCVGCGACKIVCPVSCISVV